MQNTKIQEFFSIIENKEDIIRNILIKIPNKNSLYRRINLPLSYLNLKSFLNNKEKLKERSEKHLLQNLNLKKCELYIDPDELTEEEIKVLYSLQQKMFKKFEEFANSFKDEKRKSSPKDIKESDLKTMNNLIQSALSYNIDPDDYQIEVENQNEIYNLFAQEEIEEEKVQNQNDEIVDEKKENSDDDLSVDINI